MAATPLHASEIGLPIFTYESVPNGSVFSLTSHARAKEALDLAVLSASPQHNVYVLGPEQAGRMTATVNYLEDWAATQATAEDWVYLVDFDRPHAPRPMGLAAGTGRRLRDAVATLLPALGEAIATVLSSDAFAGQMQELQKQAMAPIESASNALHEEAREAGLTLVQTQQGQGFAALDEEGQPLKLADLPDEQRERYQAQGTVLAEKLNEIERSLARTQQELGVAMVARTKDLVGQAVSRAVAVAAGEFAQHAGLKTWFEALAQDVTEHHRTFVRADGEMPVADAAEASRRYGVNLLVDRSKEAHVPVVLEQHPTYQNLFGQIEYRQSAAGALQTDVSMIRSGSLHRANGGVLVLRAEDIAGDLALWSFLQAALRDQEIRIEEFYRSAAPPMSEAPKPQPIPLKVRVVLVGSANWYYSLLAMDPGFATQFKLKAHIDSTVDATPENLSHYASLLTEQSISRGLELEPAATALVLGVAARWVGDRTRLSAAFERLLDLVVEAGAGGDGCVSADQIRSARVARINRVSQIEDQVHRAIHEQQTIIRTEGEIVGQINGLTVRSIGDHSFGSPARITARSSVGRQGIINIERLVAMSGPIAQKGTLVLQGILSRVFARSAPLSFNCSVTFEQLYGGVEGDSASMAEYIAIISDLAELPIRQDLAITGSVNQLGEAQVIGGVHHKIEGFFRACKEQGGLTGSQGVVVPLGNRTHLVVNEEVQEAVSEGRFHIWSIERVEEAVELFTGMPAGVAQAGDDTVYGRVVTTLAGFDEALRHRQL